MIAEPRSACRARKPRLCSPVRLQRGREFPGIDENDLAGVAGDRDGRHVQHGCRTLEGEEEKYGSATSPEVRGNKARRASFGTMLPCRQIERADPLVAGFDRTTPGDQRAQKPGTAANALRPRSLRTSDQATAPVVS